MKATSLRFPAFLVLALGAVALWSGTAIASDTGTCQIDAVAGNLNPPIPTIKTTALFQQTSGTYGMTGDGTCVKTDTDAGETLNSNVYKVHLESSGEYFSSWCAAVLTLYSGGPATTELTSPDPGWQGPVYLTYRMDVAGGSGSTGGTGSMAVLTAGNYERTMGIAGGGVVQTLPDSNSNCTFFGISRFPLEAEFQFAF